MIMLIEGDGPAMTAYRKAIELGCIPGVTARYIRWSRSGSQLFYVRADNLTPEQEDQVFDSVHPGYVWSYDTCQRRRLDRRAEEYAALRASKYEKERV